VNIEPDIFDYLETTSLEPHDDYTSEITYKDQKIIWNRLKKQEQEIERLNNIINELEKWLEDKDKNALQDDNYWEVLDKLQELRRIYE
jgi:hypothetical protein